ncbi:hypothetical protein WICMUC_002901 [Wickerhamomyces mucosus]|uniref:4-hydroxybenzoate polyprenyltransferase, mitochondrial n=1 Tax=Wickerhamomyces mucosus TaxID=1378264 RepID=A0A9P8PPC4_9ASCO|nr:hypothetical protein WICMUC_002901 [Wickerhamomyces mucosus]
MLFNPVRIAYRAHSASITSLLIKNVTRISKPQLHSLVRYKSVKAELIEEQPSIFTEQERKLAAQTRLKGLGPLVSKLPEKWIPYAELMRLEKPVGTWLLYIPCTWGILAAATISSAPVLTTAYMLSIFGVGSLLMRGFGCTINDFLDRDMDSKVVRTIERPIASGRVTPKQAIVFAGAQLTTGLGIILLLPWDCFILGAISLIPVCTYPLFKRFTYYPQAVLSFCFNWGVLLGFPAIGFFDWSVMTPLFLSSFFWTMTYDTIYAHQDKKFDVNAGVKSTALAWGDHSKTIFKGLSVVQFSALAVAGFNAGFLASPGFLIGSSIFGWKIFQMIKKVNLDDPKDCWKYFMNNIGYGFYLTYGLLFDYLIQALGLW